MIYCKEINNHRIGDYTLFKSVADSLNWIITRNDNELEKDYDGNLWEKGYAPVKPQEVKEQEVRAVREQYFIDYVDWYQSKPLLWEEMTEEEKQDISDYRHYLMDYTKQENWWEQNPLNFEEWKNESNI